MVEDLKVSPTDSTVGKKPGVHKFCWCQWTGEPSVSTSICGETLAIEGRLNHENLCPKCEAMPQIIRCPHCREFIRTR